MKKLGTFLLTIVLLSFTSAATQKSDERVISYGLAQHYYDEKDYLLAYKYLLMFKYSHYDLLLRNKTSLNDIDKAIDYCEKQISSVLSGTGHWKGKAWSPDQIQQFKSEKDIAQPLLPETHP